MLRQICAGSLADQLRCRTYLKYIVKTHEQKRMEHDIDIIQIVKLAV